MTELKNYAVDTAPAMEAAADYYFENSKVKSNGVREVAKPAFLTRMEEQHGITEKEIKRVQTALSHETTVAAHLAMRDIEAKIKESSADDLANADFVSDIASTIRLPTFGGSTEVTMKAQKVSPIPFRGDGEGDSQPQFKTTFGTVRTTIQAKGRIERDFHTYAADRVRSALGILDKD